MGTQTPQQLRATILGKAITPWHAVWAGVFSLLASSWLFSIVMFAWPSQKLPAFGSAAILPLSFLAGLAAFAFTVVALFRQRDWRLVFAALFGLMGIVLFTISFLMAARGSGQ